MLFHICRWRSYTLHAFMHIWVCNVKKLHTTCFITSLCPFWDWDCFTVEQECSIVHQTWWDPTGQMTLHRFGGGSVCPPVCNLALTSLSHPGLCRPRGWPEPRRPCRWDSLCRSVGRHIQTAKCHKNVRGKPGWLQSGSSSVIHQWAAPEKRPNSPPLKSCGR